MVMYQANQMADLHKTKTITLKIVNFFDTCAKIIEICKSLRHMC